MPPDPGLTPATGPQPAQIQTRPPQVRFKLDDTPPSQYLYLQDNDFLAFTFFSNFPGTALQLTYRYLTPQGEIKQGTQQFTLTGFIQSFNFTLGECWLISFGFQRTSGGSQGVIAFAQALIIRDQNTGSGQNIYGTIWQGFIQTSSGNGWPGTSSKELTDGPGNIRTIVGTAPAAGAEISETVPNNRRWTLLSFRAVLTTSAAVANRNPTFVVDDGANILQKTPSYLSQVASTIQAYSAVETTVTIGPITGDFLLTTIIPFPIRGGFHVKSATLNLQAADQWAAPIYSFLEWGSWDS